MAPKHSFVLTAVSLLALSAAAYSQPTILSQVIASGGSIVTTSSSDSIRLGSTVGQSLISSPPLSATKSLFEGFWVPWRFEMTSIHGDREAPDLLEVFPNPFATRATLRLSDRYFGEVAITLFNLAGERVRSLRFVAANSARTEIPIDNDDDLGDGLPTGIYILEVNGTTQSGTPLRGQAMLQLIQ